MTSNSARRRLLPTVVWVLLAGACTSGDSPTTTSSAALPSSSTAATTTIPPTTVAPPDPRLAEAIPVDPDVTIGQLDNGLTYYVRENFRPGDRAQLRLVVNAGSVLEDSDQSGAAHFLEHMLFNGTTRFPVNELTRVLESFGARFGPDVNAYTSFDETVYELAVATSDPAVVELAFDVLFEWAAQATIDQADVVDERGVVLEEWRLRDAGVGGRISQVYEDVLLAGTGYEGTAPIGDPDVLRTTNADALRRFYEDWYRPDLMAVIAVGDFDGAEIVDLIEKRFSRLVGPSDPPPRPVIDVAPFSDRRVAVLADPDQPSTSVEIYYPGPVAAEDTYGGRRLGWARLLASEMIATRLNDDITRGEAPFFSVDAVGFSFTRGLSVPGLTADVASVDVEPALRALVTEMERAKLHGFTDAELDRALDTWRAGVEQFYAGRASTQDVEYAGRYVSNFLEGATIASAQQEFDLDIEILESLTAADATAAVVSRLANHEITAVVIGPDDGAIPDEATLRAAIDDALAADIAARPANAAIGDTLLAPPEPIAPIEVNSLPLGITELVYANGVRVHYVQSDISVNEVMMGATSSGGLSLVDDEDVAEGFMIADIVGRSGAGAFDRVALDTFLADKFVFLQSYIDVTSEGFVGGAATEDLESLMALIHLTIVSPRADDAAVRSAIGEFRPFAEDPDQIPGLATTAELVRQRWGAEPRYRFLLTVEELDSYDVEAALNLFRDRFGDAGDFVFAFAGDFPTSTIRDLADSYLGTLPGTDRDDQWVDYQQPPPQGVVDKTIAVGESEQGFVTFLFTSEFERDARRDIEVELLNLIADVKLRDRIREALSATYSPFLSIAPADEPDPQIESYLQVSGDPERLDEIVAEALATLATLATTGPTADELATAQEQLSRQYELISNEWWVEQMLFYGTHPDESLDDLFESFRFIDETTPDDIRRLAALAFPSDRYVLVRQIPG